MSVLVGQGDEGDHGIGCSSCGVSCDGAPPGSACLGSDILGNPAHRCCAFSKMHLQRWSEYTHHRASLFLLFFATHHPLHNHFSVGHLCFPGCAPTLVPQPHAYRERQMCGLVTARRANPLSGLCGEETHQPEVHSPQPEL